MGRPSGRTESGLPFRPVYTAGRPRRLRPRDRSRGARAASRTRAASTRACTRRVPGRCGSTPASAPRRSPTRATGTDRPRHDRAVGRLRPADPDGHRLRRPARGRRGRQGRRRDRLDRGHAVLFDGIPLDEVSTSMTINAPAALLLLLYQLVAEEQGVDPATAHRHHPERRAEGVHRPRHLHLPAGRLAAPGQRHLRLLPRAAAALEHDLDLRLPHGRGRRDAGAGGRLHPRQRHRVRRGGAGRRAGGRRVRAAAVVLLRRPAPRCSRRWPSSGPPGGSGRG